MSASSTSSSSSSEEMQDSLKTNSDNNNNNNSNLEPLISISKEKGFEIEQNKDYGAGTIDLIWNIDIHPALPKIKRGFVVLRAEEGGRGGSKDWQDNQFSLRKIEEAIIRGTRSGMDKISSSTK
jgi:hypothetical protein